MLIRGQDRKTAAVLSTMFASSLFGSCAAVAAFAASPRFDVFAEKLVQKWQVGPSRIRSVEEVMRSCGGAVQGIREIISFDDEEGPYLNRANDGFVYFDCGSYSYGPVKLQSALLDALLLLSSFALPTTTSSSSSSRAILCAQIDESGTVHSPFMQQVHGVPVSGPLLTDENEFQIAHMAPSESIGWERSLSCFMEQRSQPWMLQRVKWANAEAPAHSSTHSAASNFRDKSVAGWIKAVKYDAIVHDRLLLAGSDRVNVLEPGDLIVSMGVVAAGGDGPALAQSAVRVRPRERNAAKCDIAARTSVQLSQLCSKCVVSSARFSAAPTAISAASAVCGA